MRRRITLFCFVTTTAICATAATANDFSLWVHQDDLRSLAGDPNAHLVPAALAYDTMRGRLLIACSGSDGTVIEWSPQSMTGAVLVPRDNWGGTGSPAAFAAAYAPNRDSYLIATGGDDDVIFEVMPDTADQTPAIYLAPNAGTFPAGGLVLDNTHGYYKNQWTGVQQTVNRFNLNGPPISEEVVVSPATFDAWGLAGPSQQLAIDSTGAVYLSGRPAVNSPNAVRGIYRWDAGAADLVPVLTYDEITAFTGESGVRIYGMAFDHLDALYFFELYSASVIRLDRYGQLSTLLTADEIRTWFGDSEMQVHLSYMIVINDMLVCVSGNISGHVFAVRLPIAEPDFATIPGTDYEPGGPTYPYQIGRYEITNAQYCLFLNDAERVQETNPSDPRCANMWIHPSTGDVYMSDVTAWSYGSEWYNRTLYKTSDLPDSKIDYAPTNAPGSQFHIQPGFDHHPVGTVSWYGAVKYCNWLTIRNGFGAENRCYTEGPNREDWYPVTASDWAAQGLLTAERFELVRHHRGYRLPMDGVNVDNGGPGVAHSWNIATNPYNEWYKAAAWDPAAPDTVRAGPGDYEEVQPDHWIFGFGADDYDPADENTGQSITIFPETTPVGWYNGTNLLADGTPTRDTRNRYGLYDLTGNVAEWINDTALEYPWGPNYRGQRGGQYNLSDLRWCTNTYRSIATARYYAENTDGFRILRSAGYGDFDGDDSITAPDFLFITTALTGPDFPIQAGFGHEAGDADGDQDVDLADFGAFQQSYGWSHP